MSPFSVYDWLRDAARTGSEQAGAALRQVLTLIEQKKMSPAHPLQAFSAGEVESGLSARCNPLKLWARLLSSFGPTNRSR